jgi:uncharacterized membrane protein YjgN (DUF898 family)
MKNEIAEKENLSSFDGGVLDNFGTNFVAVLLTVISLGIALPWALAYRQRWVVSHTKIEGKRLAFDGTGGQLFGNFIKWWLLSLITLGIYGAFFLPIRIHQWVAKHTSFDKG